MKKIITLSMLLVLTGVWFNAKADYDIESLGFQYIWNTEQMGQSFTTIAAGDITSITVYSYDAGVINTDLRIFNGESVLAVDEIYSESVTLSGIAAHTFTLLTPVPISAATQYTFAFDNAYLVYSDDIYAGGNAFITSAGGFAPNDLYFGVSIATIGPNPGEWTGAVDSDWNTSGNWDDGNVPTIATDVTIPGGLTIYPLVDAYYECASINISAGGELTIDGPYGDLYVAGSFLNEGLATLNGGNLLLLGDYLCETGSQFDMYDGFFGMSAFTATGTWASGAFNIYGGTIENQEFVLFGFGLLDMAGPFNWYVYGSAFRVYDGCMLNPPSDGTVHIESSYADCFVYSSSFAVTSYFQAYNLVINSPGANVYTNPGTTVGGTNLGFELLGDLDIQAGTVSTYNDGLNNDYVSIAGNCSIGVGANLTAEVVSSFDVTGSMNTVADAPGYGSLIDNGLVSAGSPSVGIYMAGPQWHSISAPVSGAVSGLFTGLYLQNFDEPSNTWNDIISVTEPLTPGVGFGFFMPVTFGAAVPGPFNSGAITNSSLTRSNLGWNMVGNPYPSPIDWDAVSGWTKTNVADATYVEDAGNWATWIAGVGTGNGSNLIAPAQGFFVECTNAAGGTLGFTDAVRTHDRTPFLKSDVANIVRLKVQHNEFSDDMVIRFLDVATEGFDYSYDAHKMFAYNEEIPQIYSMANGYMAINSLPETMMVPTGFRTSVGGQFTISAMETSDFNDVVLEDLFNGTQTDLLSDSYTFTATVEDIENRFIVHFTPLAIGDNIEVASNIYSYQKNIYINVDENTTGSITVYDVMGREVANTSIDGTLNVITLEKSGYYIVKVLGNTNSSSEKVFIK